MRNALDSNALKIVADLTRDLTAMRQQNCGHLCIENYGPEVFEKLLAAYYRAHIVESQVTYEAKFG